MSPAKHRESIPWSPATVSRPTPRRAPVAALLLAVVALLTGCTSASGAPVASPAVQDVEVEVDGRERSYLLEPATGLRQGERAALVVVLHQEGGTPEGVAAETELAALREQGATLVYPAGVDGSWDAGGCCGVARKKEVDDVAFLDALLDDVAERTPVDQARRAMVGYSSGGMLTYRYVCNRPGTLRAAVVVSGSLESPCLGQITVPDVLTVHGRVDGTIGLEKSTFVAALGLSPKPVSGTLREITRSAGCAAHTATQVSDAEVFKWTGCRGGSVEAQIISDAGHGWGNLKASQRTMEFLRGRLLAES